MTPKRQQRTGSFDSDGDSTADLDLTQERSRDTVEENADDAGGVEWQWTQAINRNPLLTREAEIELARRMRTGDDEARRLFIESNLKLVVSLARRYRGCGVPMEDLIQEGNLGLIRAVDKFDPRMGCRFSTCAVIWIEGQIRRSIGNLRHNIHLPLRTVADLNRMNRVYDELTQELGRIPNVSELAGQLEYGAEQVEQLLEVPGDPISMFESIDSEVDTVLADIIEDENAIFPADFAVEADIHRRVLCAMEHLPDRYRTVLRLRYGLQGETEHTLEEIGQLLGLTRQRVRQIEIAALQKIRCVECHHCNLEECVGAAGK